MYSSRKTDAIIMLPGYLSSQEPTPSRSNILSNWMFQMLYISVPAYSSACVNQKNCSQLSIIQLMKVDLSELYYFCIEPSY